MLSSKSAVASRLPTSVVTFWPNSIEPSASSVSALNVEAPPVKVIFPDVSAISCVMPFEFGALIALNVMPPEPAISSRLVVAIILSSSAAEIVASPAVAPTPMERLFVAVKVITLPVKALPTVMISISRSAPVRLTVCPAAFSASKLSTPAPLLSASAFKVTVPEVAVMPLLTARSFTARRLMAPRALIVPPLFCKLKLPAD